MYNSNLVSFYGGNQLNSLGRHLLIELFECDMRVLGDLEKVKAVMLEAARRAHATIVDVVFHQFNPHGISGVVVIAESHLTIHTWPEYCFAAIDVFTCGETLEPEIAAEYLVKEFGAKRHILEERLRGLGLGEI